MVGGDRPPALGFVVGELVARGRGGNTGLAAEVDRIGRGETELVRPASRFEALAFSGIHLISPRLLTMLSEDGVFSISTAYLRLAAQTESICAFRADEYRWRDLGRPENIAQAEQDLGNKL